MPHANYSEMIFRKHSLCPSQWEAAGSDRQDKLSGHLSFSDPASLAILAAIRRASSLVRTAAQRERPYLSSAAPCENT
jgi:hypothetical protein